MMSVTPISAADFIDDTFDANQVPCLIGETGVGKSEAFIAAAERRNADYKALPIGLYQVEDLVGVPSLERKRTTFNPPDLGIFHDDPIERELVVHLEELPHAPLNVQGALYECLLNRAINGKAIHSRIRFCASGNPMSSRGASNHLSTALRSRMTMARFVTDTKAWTAMAAQRGVPSIIIAFITMMAERGKEDALSAFDPKAEGNSPNPRGWVKAGEIWRVMEARKRPLEYRMIPLAGLIGEGYATEFIGFCRTLDSLPFLGNVHKMPETAPLPSATEPSVIYSVLTWLAFNVTLDRMGAYITYTQRLGSEFATTFVSMATHRDPALVECSAYVNWAVSNRSRATR